MGNPLLSGLQERGKSAVHCAAIETCAYIPARRERRPGSQRNAARTPPERKSPRTHSPCRDTRRARCRQIQLILHPNSAKSGKMRKRRQAQFLPVLVSARPCVKLFRKTVFNVNETDGGAKQPEKPSPRAHSLQRKLRENQARPRAYAPRENPQTRRTADSTHFSHGVLWTAFISRQNCDPTASANLARTSFPEESGQSFSAACSDPHTPSGAFPPPHLASPATPSASSGRNAA